MTVIDIIEPIEQREAHIIDLARIVGTEQGEPTPDAIRVRVAGNNVKSRYPLRCSECGRWHDEGESQWNALDEAEQRPGYWKPVCRVCLPSAIAAGEAILDRRSAHETLAHMLAGPTGAKQYLAYFTEPELAFQPGGTRR